MNSKSTNCKKYKERTCTGKGKKGTVWTVPELKEMLQTLGLSTKGLKAELCARLDQVCKEVGVPAITAQSLPQSLPKSTSTSPMSISTATSPSTSTSTRHQTAYLPTARELNKNIACGWSHSVGLRYDGTVKTWGDTSSSQRLHEPKEADFVQIACGWYHSVGLRANGTVKTWGEDSNDQRKDEPDVGDNTFVQIACGRYHSVGLRADGTVKTWGRTEDGQRKDEPKEADFVQIACGYFHSVGLRADGTVKTWGDTSSSQRLHEPKEADFVQIACGWYHSVGLRANGTIKIWGDRWGEPKEADFVQIACGMYHSVGLRKDGTVKTLGSTSFGQSKDEPPEEDNDFAQIACGYNHSVGLRRDGTVKTWGQSGHGQRSDEPTEEEKFVQIACGAYHSVGLRKDGTVITWGDDSEGQREDGTNINLDPRKSSLIKARKAAQRKKTAPIISGARMELTPWQEICMYLDSQYRIDELREMARQLGIDTKNRDGAIKSKRHLCVDLAKDYEQYLSGKQVKRDCKNEPLIEENYNLIPDDRMIIFDGYCFSLDEFEGLLRDGRNPYTRDLLPKSAIDEYTQKRQQKLIKQEDPRSRLHSKKLKTMDPKLLQKQGLISVLSKIQSGYQYLPYDRLVKMSESSSETKKIAEYLEGLGYSLGDAKSLQEILNVSVAQLSQKKRSLAELGLALDQVIAQ